MKKILFYVTLLFMLPLAASSQTAWLYEGCNFTGVGHSLGVGQYRLFQMKIGNDRLQGLMIPNGLKVTIYENDNFQGRSRTYFSNQPCLEPEFRNMASSVIIELSNNNPANQNDYATFFNDCSYRGYSQSFTPGTYSGSQIGELKFNISSLRIQGNVVVKAYLNNEYNSGLAITLDNSSPCLPSQYNDKIGSFTVEYRANNNNNNNNSGGRPRSYATLYSECQYSGNAIRLQPGNYEGYKLGILKFNIQSIELPQNLRLRVYLNSENISGFSQTINQSSTCLPTQFINRIGALIVEEVNTGGWGNGGNNGGGWGNNGGGTGNNGGGIGGLQSAYLFTDNDFRGQSIALNPGNYPSLSAMGFPEQSLSSIQIASGYRVVLYDQPNFRGASYTLTSSRMSLNILGWNDRAASIVIVRD